MKIVTHPTEFNSATCFIDICVRGLPPLELCWGGVQFQRHTTGIGGSAPGPAGVCKIWVGGRVGAMALSCIMVGRWEHCQVVFCHSLCHSPTTWWWNTGLTWFKWAVTSAKRHAQTLPGLYAQSNNGCRRGSHYSSIHWIAQNVANQPVETMVCRNKNQLGKIF